MKIDYDNKSVWISYEDEVDKKALKHLFKDKLIPLCMFKDEMITYRRISVEGGHDE